jgi:hypothetical protein
VLSSTLSREQIGLAALRLAGDIPSCQALVAGLPVARSRLRADVLAEIGEPLAGEPLELDEVLVLRIEAARQVEENVEPDIGDPTVTFDEFVARRDEGASQPLVSSPDHGTLLPVGGLAILAARVHDGKTTLAVEFAQHAGAGCEYLGLSFPRPLNVLVIENEGPREAFRSKLAARLTHWKHGGEPRVWDVPAEWGQVRISDPSIRERLRGVVEGHHVDLILSDSLTRFGVRGNGTPEETREFVEWLSELGLGRDVSFLLLHHPRTRPEQGESELERLAGAWPPHADLIMLLQKLGDGRARLSFPKTRWATGQRPPSILAFDAAAESFSYVSDAVETEERDYVAELVELMEEGEWWTVTALRKPKEQGGIGAAPDAVKDALTAEVFESTAGDEIGKRKDSTYYRLRQASRPPGDGGDASSLWPERGEASPSPPRERARGGDASSGPGASADDDPVAEDEVERLAELARETQNTDAAEEAAERRSP